MRTFLLAITLIFVPVSPAQLRGQSSEQSARSVRVSGGVMAGQILTKVDPTYPAEAKQQGIAGSVVLHARIGIDGSVEQLDAISGLEALPTAALAAVKQWTYRPYLLNGKPVAVDTTITVNFTLAGALDS